MQGRASPLRGCASLGSPCVPTGLALCPQNRSSKMGRPRNSARRFNKDPLNMSPPKGDSIYCLGAFGGSHFTVCIWTFMASVGFPRQPGASWSPEQGVCLSVKVLVLSVAHQLFLIQLIILFLKKKKKATFYLFVFVCVVGSVPQNS